MKKIVLSILMTGFAIAVSAQSTTEEPEVVNTECVAEEGAEEVEEKKQPKKHKNKMATYKKADSSNKKEDMNNPYAYAPTINRKKTK